MADLTKVHPVISKEMGHIRAWWEIEIYQLSLSLLKITDELVCSVAGYSTCLIHWIVETLAGATRDGNVSWV